MIKEDRFTKLEFDMQKIEHMIEKLGSFGRCLQTGVSRTAFSSEWVSAQECIAEWSREVGLNVRFDTAGNLWARIDGTEGGKSIVSGSHIDSQCPGGRFDGALGVLSALIAISVLKEAYGSPRKPIFCRTCCVAPWRR